VELDAVARVVIRRLTGNEASCHGAAMLGTAAARIVLVQIVGQCVPSATDAHHYVGTKDLKVEVPYVELRTTSFGIQYLPAQR